MNKFSVLIDESDHISVLSRKYLHMKSCISGQGVVANPRDTTWYRCGLRLARTRKTQFQLCRDTPDRTLIWSLSSIKTLNLFIGKRPGVMRHESAAATMDQTDIRGLATNCGSVR